MARRKTPRRPGRQPKVVAWSPAIEGLFRLAAVGWTPPATVRVSQGGASMTWSADFADEKGQSFTLKVRLRRAKDGWKLAEETLQTRLSYRAGAAE